MTYAIRAIRTTRLAGSVADEPRTDLMGAHARASIAWDPPDQAAATPHPELSDPTYPAWHRRPVSTPRSPIRSLSPAEQMRLSTATNRLLEERGIDLYKAHPATLIQSNERLGSALEDLISLLHELTDGAAE